MPPPPPRLLGMDAETALRAKKATENAGVPGFAHLNASKDFYYKPPKSIAPAPSRAPRRPRARRVRRDEPYMDLGGDAGPGAGTARTGTRSVTPSGRAPVLARGSPPPHSPVMTSVHAPFVRRSLQRNARRARPPPNVITACSP